MSSICNRKHAISLLLSNDPDLLDFLFTPDRSRLDWDNPHEAAFTASMMQRERFILVKIALDIWNCTGYSRLPEIYQHLGSERFEAFSLAMEQLWGLKGCHCLGCSQRLHPPLGHTQIISEA